MFKNKSNKILFIVAVSMITVSTVSGYVMAKTSVSPFKEEVEEKVSQNCEITHVYNFTTCGESEEDVIMADRSQVGLTKSELAKTIDDGRITYFSSDEVTVTHDIRQYCNKHFILQYENDALYIKVNEDYDAELETQLDLGKLRAPLKTATLEKLKTGIVFSDINEAKKYASQKVYK